MYMYVPVKHTQIIHVPCHDDVYEGSPNQGSSNGRGQS